ncbi:MAG TPA: class F sortase, partial [Candidatus Dormibacteraeota bacterium]|nr:class F sortase [Candidatus Dormibacteraeota bacterium]
MRTWPSVAQHVRASARVLGGLEHTWSSSIRSRFASQVQTVRTWPALARGGMPTQVLGEIVLAVLLLATLAFSPRDGFRVDENFAWPTESITRLAPSAVEEPSFGLTLPGVSSLSERARAAGVAFTTQALIPTAPPVQLLIPSLGVHRPVEGVGTDRRGVLDLPVNGWNAGWYKRGPTPGAPGDAVIEGHAGFPDQPMLFGKLATLRQGDKIIVVLADGSQRLFLVESMAVLPVGSAPPGMGEPYG